MGRLCRMVDPEFVVNGARVRVDVSFPEGTPAAEIRLLLIAPEGSEVTVPDVEVYEPDGHCVESKSMTTDVLRSSAMILASAGNCPVRLVVYSDADKGSPREAVGYGSVSLTVPVAPALVATGV